MRVQLSRRPTRTHLIALVALTLAGIALLLGVFFPPDRPDAGASLASSTDVSTGASLLISEFSDTASQLWLLDPTAPAERTPFLRIDHAPGWELRGAVAPEGDQFAFVVLTPGRTAPESEATLFLSDGGPPRILAEGVDLGGGVTWSQDGSSVLVRRTTLGANDTRTFAVLEVRVSDGRQTPALSSADAVALQIVGRPLDGPLYAALIGPDGTRLASADANEKRRVLTSSSGRDWALSPDGARLAFTEQTGVSMRVRVVSLDADAPVASPAMRSALPDGQPLLESAGADTGSASPVWGPDGTLSVGVFTTPSGELRTASVGAGDGFVLPVAWSPDGAYLAVRSFDGRGPGASTREWASLVDADGATHDIPGEHVRVLGWWSGATR